MEMVALPPLLPQHPVGDMPALLPLHPSPSCRHRCSSAPFHPPPPAALNANTFLRPSTMPLCSPPPTVSFGSCARSGKLQSHSFREPLHAMVWKETPAYVETSLPRHDYFRRVPPSGGAQSSATSRSTNGHLPPLLPLPQGSLLCKPPWCLSKQTSHGPSTPITTKPESPVSLLQSPPSPHRWNETPLLPLPSSCG
eukprot:GHVS01045714.1.p1 GENE.GHVS01045714.1~~GHVS01045714.1.p1  ORF type:complete len:196 (-),score=32.28 GHVS01045714.1:1039-1626(-)